MSRSRADRRWGVDGRDIGLRAETSSQTAGFSGGGRSRHRQPGRRALGPESPQPLRQPRANAQVVTEPPISSGHEVPAFVRRSDHSDRPTVTSVQRRVDRPATSRGTVVPARADLAHPAVGLRSTPTMTRATPLLIKRFIRSYSGLLIWSRQCARSARPAERSCTRSPLTARERPRLRRVSRTGGVRDLAGRAGQWC